MAMWSLEILANTFKNEGLKGEIGVVILIERKFIYRMIQLFMKFCFEGIFLQNRPIISRFWFIRVHNLASPQKINFYLFSDWFFSMWFSMEIPACVFQLDVRCIIRFSWYKESIFVRFWYYNLIPLSLKFLLGHNWPYPQKIN